MIKLFKSLPVEVSKINIIVKEIIPRKIVRDFDGGLSTMQGSVVREDIHRANFVIAINIRDNTVQLVKARDHENELRDLLRIIGERYIYYQVDVAPFLGGRFQFDLQNFTILETRSFFEKKYPNDELVWHK